MTEYDFKKGLYPYPLKYLPSDGGTDMTPFVSGDPTVQPNSTNWYILCLTPDELQALRNIINVGSPIVYPDTYIKYWRLFSQLEQFPNEIPEDSCMDLCTLILDCINSTPALQQAIADYSLGSAIDGATVEDSTILASNIVSDQGGCNNDNIYGMTIQLVQFVNSINEDILELFVNAPFAAGRLGDIIEAIPGIGELPFDDMLQFADNFLEDINDAYQSAYTVSLEQEMACDLFCLAQDNNCTLTWEQARDYYADKTAVLLDTTDWSKFVEDLIANNWIGTTTVYVMYYLFFQTLIYGGEILGQNSEKVNNIIASMFNDPDPDWNINCDPCVSTWQHTFDFTVSDGGFYVVAPAGADALGQYVASTGWSTSDGLFANPDHYGRAVSIRKDFTTSNITKVEMAYNYVKGTWAATGTALSVNARTGNTVEMSFTKDSDTVSNGNGQSDEVNGDVNADNIRLLLNSSRVNSQNYDGSALITSCTVHGTGTNPF